MSVAECAFRKATAACLAGMAFTVVCALPLQCCVSTVRAQWKPETALSAHPEARWKFLASYIDKPALGDVTGDGVPEIIGTSVFGDVFCVDGRSGRILWAFEDEHSFEIAIYICPAVVDVNCDRIVDVISVTPKGRVVCLDGRNGRKIWVYQADAAVVSSPTVFDLKRDGTPETAFADLSGSVYLLDDSGKLVWKAAEGAPFHGAPAMGVVDGQPLVLISDRMGVLRGFDGANGALLWRIAPARGPISTQPVVFKDEKDAAHPWKALIGTDLGGLIAVNPKDGALIWSRILGRAEAIGDLALGDVNGDGLPDCVFSTSASRVVAVSAADGREIWSRKLKIPLKLNPTINDLRRIRTDVISGEPILTDIDGDGLEDVVIDIRGPNNLLYALRGLDAKVLWSWGTKNLLLNSAPSETIVVGVGSPGSASGPGSHSVPVLSQPTPAIADFDGDGNADLIINDRDEIGLISVPLSVAAGAGKWSKYAADPCNNTVRLSLPCIGEAPGISLSLTVDPPEIFRSEAARLCWKSTGARAVEIDPGIGVVGPEGCSTVSAPHTSTWQARARGCEGELTRRTTLAVKARPTPAPAQSAPEAPPEVGPATLEDVVFEVDRYQLTPVAKTRLDRIALQLREASWTSVILEAGCDEEDSSEFCEYLAQARGEAVREYLIERGIDAARLELREVGTGLKWNAGRTGRGWATNRNVHFIVLTRVRRPSGS